MSYLEKELDQAIKTLEINSRKLEPGELTDLISALTKTFYKSQSNILDPIHMNEKSAEHNPNFWQEIQHRVNEKDLILLVCDSKYRGWQIESAHDVTSLLGETTGYPFWLTDTNLTFLLHMDDHDCVTWA